MFISGFRWSIFSGWKWLWELVIPPISDGYLLSGDVNTCDECWDMLNHSNSDDLSDMISDADPGL